MGKLKKALKAINDAKESARGPFDAEGGGFDIETAVLNGMKRDATGHFGSVVEASQEQKDKYKLPQESFLMLKGVRHPTFHKAVKAEAVRGFEIVRRGGRYWSVPIEKL